jgi:hypothetical protein
MIEFIRGLAFGFVVLHYFFSIAYSNEYFKGHGYSDEQLVRWHLFSVLGCFGAIVFLFLSI